MSNTLKSLFQLINSMSSLYIAPYHRNYVWDVNVCADFISKPLNGEEVDFGVITYQKTDDQGNYILIDGYQRLMTILIFVQAVIKTSKVNLAQKNRPINFLVYNTDLEEIFKLKINNNDKKDIENIIKNNIDDHIFNNINFKSNYDYFVGILENNDIPVLEFLNNLAGIKIVNIIFDNKNADEEDVYSSINNTFSQIDLIRNFVYKDLKTTKNLHIFNTYWLGLEKDLGGLITGFMADYLTIQNNGLIAKSDTLYDNFVSFYKKILKLKSGEDLIQHIYRYASFYIKIIFADIIDEEIKEKLETINNYGATDTYPYLMEVFEDYEFAHINKNMLIDILNTVIVFVEERNINSDGVWVNFAQLSSDINKMLALKDFTPKIITEQVDETINIPKVTINDLIKKQSAL